MQAAEEIRILECLNRLKRDNEGQSNFPIIQMYEHFTFRGHTCLTFELLNITLYDLLKITKFAGLPRDRVRRIGSQILQALFYMEQANIIHCDLKPENVLLVWPQSSEQENTLQVPGQKPRPFTSEQQDIVKLIDFGSSAFRNGPTYPYIQSRFYRAPEVILRNGYAHPIDIWSFGCLIAELVNGEKLLNEIFIRPKIWIVTHFGRK